MSDSSIIDVDIDFPNPYNFSTSEAAKGNILIVGQTSSGKTKLACAIVDLLQKCGWDIVIFDPTGVWRRVSSAHRYQKLLEGKTNCLKLISPSIIYDMSNLYIDTQKTLVNDFCKWLWETRVNEDPDKLRPLMIVLEEAQLFTRNVKSQIAQELFRMAMSGRNLKVRLMLISPRLNNVATEFVFLSTQKYIGLSNEQNVSRKIRSMYGREISESCKFLGIGEFIYAARSEKPYWIKIPEFMTSHRPAMLGKSKGRSMGLSMEAPEDLEEYDIPYNPMGGITILLFLLSIAIIIKLLI